MGATGFKINSVFWIFKTKLANKQGICRTVSFGAKTQCERDYVES